MTCNLYLVRWRNLAYGQYDSMVVCAPDVAGALLWHPSGALMEELIHDARHHDWAHPHEHHELAVTHVGTAVSGMEPGVLCASYLARDATESE